MLTLDKTQLFGHIAEQHVNDAAFLWMQRSQAVNHAHHTVASIAKLERRISKHLQGLALAPRHAWSYAMQAAEFKEGGEIFILAVVALTSGEKQKIETALEFATDNRETLQGFTSALGWLGNEQVYPWLKPWITSDSPAQQYVALAACSVRRLDPQAYLTVLLKEVMLKDIHLQHTALFSRALRLAGELKRQDLAPVLAKAQGHEHPEVAFWACWSSVLLGDRAALQRLEAYVVQPGPLQTRAIDIAFRCLNHAQAWAWINQLNSDPNQTQQTALALATLGDPQGINWLLARMEEAPHAKMAGEAFCMITGADLEREGLVRSPTTDARGSADEAEDEDVPALDGYEGLPLPDPNKVSQYWQQIRHGFSRSQRYFLGELAAPPILQNTLKHGRQHQRLAAALTYGLLDGTATYPNAKATLYGKD